MRDLLDRNLEGDRSGDPRSVHGRSGTHGEADTSEFLWEDRRHGPSDDVRHTALSSVRRYDLVEPADPDHEVARELLGGTDEHHESGLKCHEARGRASFHVPAPPVLEGEDDPDSVGDHRRERSALRVERVHDAAHELRFGCCRRVLRVRGGEGLEGGEQTDEQAHMVPPCRQVSTRTPCH